MTRTVRGESRNRVVIVTGGGRGIGRATARRFAEAGDTVIVWDVDDRDAAGTLAELGSVGGDATFESIDVSRAPEVAAAVDAIVERHGRIDVLINNAGIVRDAQLVKWRDGAVAATMSESDFDAVIGVNLRGVFLCTRAVAPTMIAAGRGVILNAGSVVGRYGNFGQTSYVAAKAAVVGMTRTWARELGRHGIRVNAVAPGFVDTAMSRSVPSAILDGMVARTPLRRLGEPRDIAEAYFWLASDAASFVHGTCLEVDGGLVLGT